MTVLDLQQKIIDGEKKFTKEKGHNPTKIFFDKVTCLDPSGYDGTDDIAPMDADATAENIQRFLATIGIRLHVEIVNDNRQGTILSDEQNNRLALDISQTHSSK